MKKFISLLISIVLAVSAFTAAYATEGITATNEGTPVIQERPREDGVIEEEHSDAQEEHGYAQGEHGVITQEEIAPVQKEQAITQVEHGLAQEESGEITHTVITEDELREMVIQYAKNLLATYSPSIRRTFLIEQNVNQSIVFLQARYAELDAIIQKIDAKINEVKRWEPGRKAGVIMGLIVTCALIILNGVRSLVQASAAPYRALIEAKQYYNFKLDGED